MADSLVGMAEGLGLLPDNVTQEVTPEDVRRVALSFLADRGNAYGDPAASPWVVPIPAVDTWVNIQAAIAPNNVEGDALFWRMDANGALFYDYAADWPTTDVPAGHIRQVTLLGVVNIDPNGDTWQFAFDIGGVVQEPITTIETAGQTDAVVATIVSGDPVDVSLAPPVSLLVRNTDTDADLTLNLVSIRTTGGPLA